MYIHDGLGEPWYEKALDVVAETGAAIAEGAGGKAAGDAIRGFHKGWTSAVFGPKNQPAVAQMPASAQMPMPAQAPMPAPRVLVRPVMRPAPAVPRILHPPPAGPPDAVAASIFGSSRRGGGQRDGGGSSTLLIVGGIGLTAAVLYFAMRRK